MLGYKALGEQVGEENSATAIILTEFMQCAPQRNKHALGQKKVLKFNVSHFFVKEFLPYKCQNKREKLKKIESV